MTIGEPGTWSKGRSKVAKTGMVANYLGLRNIGALSYYKIMQFHILLENGQGWLTWATTGSFVALVSHFDSST